MDKYQIQVNQSSFFQRKKNYQEVDSGGSDDSGKTTQISISQESTKQRH